uniref:Small ribosomal subunit protein uS11c n=1 Tax=Derbesia sp. WEST4838 TaxID=1847751 RepID=A0A1C9JBD2_9CHLO|nr:ribosomal protein S11 [Derbesia sp. WEST4838]AOP19152.1 ribosomal protein S11 [Derbesia sp. WEST4838]
MNIQKLNLSKQKMKINKGVIYIYATFNNTILTLCNVQNKVLFWTSAGSCGFKGARKGTPFSSKITIEKLVKYAREQGIKSLYIIIKGPGPGRETVIRNLQKSSFEILLICDRTPLPHNGCRPPKKRRV